MTGPARNRSHHAAQRRTAGGFSLLEVLIALVVLSIGLLGIAALQGVGLRSSHGAYLTSQATLLAYDMADRIRANPGQRATYDAHDHDVATAGCDTLPATPLAVADLAEWACAVQELLPAGRTTLASVNSLLTPGAVTYTITIEWRDQQAELDNADAEVPWTYTMDVDI